MTELTDPARSPLTRRHVLAGALAGAAMTLSPAASAIAGSAATLGTNTRMEGTRIMSMITTKDGVQIFYKDWGHGQPIVFHHGWPLSSDDWDALMLFFVQHGYRVVAFDRRGHGRSSQVSDG
ncbi:MAG: alpha/beta hydrolase, partial [Aliidongia sp.]